MRFLLFLALLAGFAGAQTYTFSSCKSSVTLTVTIDSIISTTGPFPISGGHSTGYIFYGDFTLTVNGAAQTRSNTLGAAHLDYLPNGGGLVSEFLIETADQTWAANLQGPGDLIPAGVFPATLPPVAQWTTTSADYIRYGSASGQFAYVDTLGSCSSSSTGVIQITNVISAGAFGALPAIAPGTWIEIYGSDLAPDTRTWTTADFSGVNAPTSLDGVQVTINGEKAFVSYIGSGSPSQVNVQVPSDISPGTASVVVINNGLPTQPYTVTVKATEPGLLAPASFKIGGQQYAAAIFPDFATYVLPVGAIAGIASRPAKPGDLIVLYGIGFGPVAPSQPAGQVVGASNSLAATLQIFFGGVQAQVGYEGLSAGNVGLYQFNVTVPQVPNNALTPLTFSLGGVPGTQTMYIPVGQ